MPAMHKYQNANRHSYFCYNSSQPQPEVRILL